MEDESTREGGGREETRGDRAYFASVAKPRWARSYSTRRAPRRKSANPAGAGDIREMSMSPGELEIPDIASTSTRKMPLRSSNGGMIS